MDLLPGGGELWWRVSAGQLMAVASIVILSWVNWLGVREGKLVQNTLTVIKICILAALVILGLTLGRGQDFAPVWHPAGMDFHQLVMGFGVALVAVSWAFDGWNNVNFAAGEIRNPSRNLPKALVLGTLLVTVLYLLVNIPDPMTMPHRIMAASKRPSWRVSPPEFW